jgi:hypothetical protein
MNMPLSPRKVNERIAQRIALAMLCVGTAYGCAVSNADGVDRAAASADEAGGVELADGPIGTVGPTPTVTATTPLPPVDFVYHATIDLDPGFNSSEGVFDEEKNSPFRVKVKDTLGLDGKLTVYVSTGSDVTPSPTVCSQFKLEYTVDGYNASSQTWVPVANRAKTGVYVPAETSGEFPDPAHCLLRDYFDVTNSAHSNLRVFAKGYRKITSGTLIAIIPKSTGVQVYGTNPVPDPQKQLHVTSVALNATNTSALATVKNDGPLAATGVVATLSGTYKYCPPAQQGESRYCNAPNEWAWNGYYANPDVNPGGNPVYPHRNPKICTIDDAADPLPRTITANQTVTYVWSSSKFVSNDSGCAPCIDDGRCYDLNLVVETDATSETDPWDDWDQAEGSKKFPGLFVN